MSPGYGFSAELLEYARQNPITPGRGTITGRVVLEGKTVHVEDVLADPEFTGHGYQSRARVVANEYAAKFWLVADSIRYHRSDTALVRVWVPVLANDEASATATGERFVQALFPELRQYLPS